LEHTRIFLSRSGTKSAIFETRLSKLEQGALPGAFGGEILTNLNHLLHARTFDQLCLSLRIKLHEPTCCTGFLPPFEEENILQNSISLSCASFLAAWGWTTSGWLMPILGLASLRALAVLPALDYTKTTSFHRFHFHSPSILNHQEGIPLRLHIIFLWTRSPFSTTTTTLSLRLNLAGNQQTTF
jgi:hypothetical protein